jgi:hypothetical protein
MNSRALMFVLLLPLGVSADSWLIGGQSASPMSFSSGSFTNLDHDASNDTEIVNFRTATNLIDRRLLYTLPLPDTGGVVFVDAAAGLHQMHAATSNVTFQLAERLNTNTYESFHLHVLANLYTLSFATNHLDAASVAALPVSSNTFFSFRLVGPAGSDRWYVTEIHDALYVPPDLSAIAAGLTNGLIFYTPFDGSADDLTGVQLLRGSNTTDGTPIGYTNGVLGSAAVFVATNRTYFSYTNTTSAALAPFCDNELGFSVSWWEYKLALGGDFIDVLIGGAYDGEGPFHDNLSYYPGNEEFIFFLHHAADEYLVQRGGSGGVWWLDYTPPANTWVHMVFVFDPSGSAEVFINGEFYESASMSLGFAPSGHFLIGNLHEFSHWSYNGYLDEVAMWNRTLSALEIRTIYNQGTGRAILP